MSTPWPSLISIVDRCDNFRRETATETFAEFRLSPNSSHIIGLVPPDVLTALEKSNTSSQSPAWNIHRGSELEEGRGAFITFADWVDTPAKRTQVLKDLTEGWRDGGLFSNVISPRLWRNELYAVYVDAFGPRTDDTLAFAMERTACALFGVVTYGVHMTMYDSQWRIWVPTRAKTKQTWPLYLDNSVAGGIPHDLSPFESIVKECSEEAGLDETLVRAHVKPRGAVSYFFRSPRGYLQPEVQFIYDLFIPPEQEDVFTPRPSDGEVDSFRLEDIDTIVAKMHEDLFKPNCALVIVDFLIRHGIITPENEPNYLDIVTRLHGRFGYEL